MDRQEPGLGLVKRRSFLNLEMAADRGVRDSWVTQADPVC